MLTFDLKRKVYVKDLFYTGMSLNRIARLVLMIFKSLDF